MKSPSLYRGVVTRPQSSPLVLQRKLTLDDFPMEHGVRDAQQRALSSRQERSRLQDWLQSARVESGSLREYSRRRFQTVVELETKAHPHTHARTHTRFIKSLLAASVTKPQNLPSPHTLTLPHPEQTQIFVPPGSQYYIVVFVVDRFYIALFSVLEQTHCARVLF